MTGREGHDSYAPCTEQCLRDSGYDYWALGHIHLREVLPGVRPTIAYPGNVQGRHIRETGAKGCLVVRVDNANNVTTEFHPLDVLRWEIADVALDDALNETAVLDRVEGALLRLVEEADGRMVAARVLLSGATPLASDLTANSKQWTANIRARAIDISGGALWIEKVKSHAEPPRETDRDVDSGGPMAEVAAIVEDLLKQPSIAQSLGLDFDDLQRKLPPEVQDAIRSGDSDWWLNVLHDAKAKLLTILKG